MLHSLKLRTSFFLLVVSLVAAPLSANPIFLNGTGGVSYGVADYGGAPVGAPTYIPNNFTGLVDILTSPGGGYLTADTSIPNNIYESGVGGLPVFFGAAGGANGNGIFGVGNTLITGPTVGGSLLDANPDGIGAASYTIASWISNWSEPVGYIGPIGAWIAAGGTFGSAVSAGALSLRVRVQSAGLGVIDFPQLVLAPRANGPCFGLSGVVFCDGDSFAGLAWTSQDVNIPQGDALTVFATLTAIADPMFFQTIDPALDANLQPFLSELSTFNFVSSQAVPEPATWALALIGVGLLGVSRRRK